VHGERSGWWRGISIMVLIVQPLIFYRRHLFSLTGHIPFDLPSFHLPMAAFIERSIHRGVWPFWNPFEYCGTPIHADITAQLFYPPAWAAILVDQLTGGTRLLYWLEWLGSVHMIVGGIGVYFLLRRFACSPLVSLYGSTVFQIGPFFVSQAEHLGAICTAAWFPIILLCIAHLAEQFDLRWLAGLALCVSMSVLSGFPAALIVSVALSGLFCGGLIWSHFAKPRLLIFFATGCLLGTAIASIQLVPTIQLSTLSIASLRYKWLGNGGGLHWESLASLVWPNYYGTFSAWDRTVYKLPYEVTFMYTFCGYIALGLLAASLFLLRRSRLLVISTALFVVSTIWMLGERTPVYPLVFKSLPHFVQNALYAEYALLGFSVFAALTAALVLAHFEPRMPRVLLVVLVAANSWNLIRTGANKVLLNSFPGSYAVGSGWVDGGRSVPETLQALTGAETPPLRIDLMSDVAPLEEGRPGLFELFSATGDNPFLLLRYYHLRGMFSDAPESSRKQHPRSLDNPLLRAFNVGYVLDNGDAPNRELPSDQYASLPFRSVRVYKVHNPLPRFYVRAHILRVRDEQEALDKVKSPAFDPEDAAIVEGLDDQWRPNDAAIGSVRVLNYGNNRLELDVRTSGRALLVTSESLYPGWTATVNGRPARILATNVAFRGLMVEAGESHVVMRYFPTGFIFSSVMTVLGLTLTVLLLTSSRRFQIWSNRA
jgi:hypothetical protein